MMRLGKGRFRLSRGQRGFNLIEVLVAVAILAAIGVTFMSALDTNDRAVRTLDEQVVAANLATAHLEAIKGLAYTATYPNAGDNITIPFQYSVAIDIQYSDNGTTWSDNWTDQHLEKITIIVSRQGKLVLSICSYRSER